MTSDRDLPQRATALDKDLKKFVRLEKAAQETGVQAAKVGLGILFLLLVLVYLLVLTGGAEGSLFIVVAGVTGGYMALNIGANDVANNVGPAVGSRALTMAGALVIAAVFETMGAILAGGDVVSTISKGIIDPSVMLNSQVFVWAMLAALMAAALWLNFATFIGAPVSTTHSIVGGVLGAGVAAAGVSAVNWQTMGTIAASWVISPVLGGLIASIFLAVIKYLIVFKKDRIAAARRWVPILVAVMAMAFTTYLMTKGLRKIWHADPTIVAIAAVAAFVGSYLVVKPLVERASRSLENNRASVSTLFTVPLICSAALLSFAHGANDVANAVGPLAGIVDAARSGGIASKVEVPLWVMLVGGLGISAGLLLFGPKLVRLVGEKITRLDRMRAFTVALSAAITVIVASALGLPVSSTHIAVGAVFGVGFFREFLANRRRRGAADMAPELAPSEDGSVESEAVQLALIDLPPGEQQAESRKDVKKQAKARKRRLVRRRHLLTILAAWIVTVPLSAAMAALFFFTLRGLLLP